MVGIVCIGQIELSPFSKKYIDVLNDENVAYDIIHWNRSGIKSDNDDKNYTFSEQLERYGSLLSKITPFFRFRRFVKKIIKERKYDKLIVLTTQTAVMLPDVLFGRYKNKYFFDYRDTSYEYLKPYKMFINHIIMMSYATCVSSPGFKKYLTEKKEILIAHNFQDTYYKTRALKCRKSENDKIVIGYIGYLREYEYLIKFVDAFGRDERFEFHVHGSGDCVEKLRDFSKKYNNVTIYGAYEEKNKMDIIDTFDIICYNYPYSFVNYPAIANKFYDGMIRKKPMFGNLNTFSGELIKKHNLGISLAENDSNISEKVYEYYKSFSTEQFETECEKFMNSVINDDEIYRNKIKDFLKS